MVTRWTQKIITFLHDPPGKPFILRSEKHEPHDQLAAVLQSRALNRTASSEEADKARKADHIASAADRINFPGDISAYWDQVEPLILHPLAQGAPACEVSLPPGKRLSDIDHEIQEKAAAFISEWSASLKGDADGGSHFKRLYFYLWRFLYEDLGRVTSVGRWVELLPADTRQPEHSLWHHLSISAAIAGALPCPSFLVFSIGPVQDFIAAARRTQDLWMGSWILSYLSWKAMEVLAERFGPDVVVFPSLWTQPLCEYWLWKSYQIPCEPDRAALARPTFPNKFVALLPAQEAAEAARKAEKTVKDAWHQMASEVLKALRDYGVFGNDEHLEGLWQKQIQSQLEVYWSVLPWAGCEGSDSASQAEKVKELYESLTTPPSEWLLGEVYRKIVGSGKYKRNWGTVWSLLYDLADRAFNARKNLRNFEQAEETGDKCTQCGQQAALRADFISAREFWGQVSERLRERGRYDIKPEGRERLCAVCTVKRFVQREVLEREFNLRGGFPSTSEIAAATFKRQLLGKLKEGSEEVRRALKNFLARSAPCLETVAQRAIPYLERECGEIHGEEERRLAEKILRVDGEWLHIESWTLDRLKEAGCKADENVIRETRDALRGLYQAAGAKPAKYYALLYMDGDQMGRWLSGTHEGLATFGDILHPEVREALQNASEWQPLLGMKRLITPAVHAAISQALGRFALKLVPHIVEERHPGRLIYAGGDDVLALVPLEDALAVARELRAAFSGHIRFVNGDLQVCLGDSVTGYVKWRDEIFLTMGPKATASIGLVFAHHLQPLDLVLDAAREAERLAKHHYGRNALVVTLLKRSGERLTAGTQGSYREVPDVVHLLITLIQELRERRLSSRWPYAVEAEAYVLEGLSPAAQKAELRRLLRRHSEAKPSSSEKAIDLERLPECLTNWAQAMGCSGFTEMSRWLQVCGFIVRGGEV